MFDKLSLKSTRWLVFASLALIVLVLSGCSVLNPSIVVVNNMGEDLCVITLNGGDNLLADPLPDGETFTTEVEAGTYDIHGESCEGLPTDSEDVVLEAGDEFTWTLTIETE